MFNYVSMVYVVGMKSGQVDEMFVDEFFKFNNLYEESKCLCERQVVDVCVGQGI